MILRIFRPPKRKKKFCFSSEQDRKKKSRFSSKQERNRNFCFAGAQKYKIRSKMWAFVIIFFIFLSCFYGRFDLSQGFVKNVAYADSETSEVEKELQDEVASQLDNLDFSDVEEAISLLSSDAKRLFSSNSFKDKLTHVLSGDYAENSTSFFSAVMSIFWDGLKGYVPIIASIIAISILGGMIENLKPTTNSNSIGNVVHFVTYGMVIIFLGTSLVQILATTRSTLSTIKSAYDGIFPILLTLLTAVGGTVSVGLYQPAIAMLSNIFVSLITHILLPIFIFSCIFSLVGNMSNNVQLDKFVGFLQSLFKWAIGLCFTIFLGFISIQGIMAGSIDGLSIRTAKYAIKSYVPLVGGYVSDGFSIILASSALIKNAVGGVGLFFVFSSIISPILHLAIFILSLKFMAGIIQPIGDKKIANFISDLSKSLSMLVGLLVAVSFLYVVMTGLVMCSANLIV